MNTTSFTFQGIFSLASRERCIANLKKFRMPLINKNIKMPTDTAAVLVPLCRVNNIPSLLYTVRSMQLKSHSGQISFPGGKTDKDETPIDTALRETHEEIGLSREKIEVWGCTQALPGRNFKIMITPVVGSIPELEEKDLSINKNEVDYVFTAPLESLCDPKNQFYTQYKNGFILPVFVINEFRIWGITAYITHIVLSCLLPQDIYKNNWMQNKIPKKNLINEITY